MAYTGSMMLKCLDRCKPNYVIHIIDKTDRTEFSHEYLKTIDEARRWGFVDSTIMADRTIYRITPKGESKRANLRHQMGLPNQIHSYWWDLVVPYW